MTMFYILVLSIFVAAQARPHDPDQYAYSWKDCGSSASRPVRFHNIQITPDPVQVPGSVFLSFDVEAKEDIINMDLKLTLKKKLIFSYITIPCINRLGSCTYKDLCSYLDRLPGQPVSCPVKATRITKHNVELPIPDPGALGIFLNGQFLARAKLTDTATGKEMGCFEIKLKLRA